MHIEPGTTAATQFDHLLTAEVMIDVDLRQTPREAIILGCGDCDEHDAFHDYHRDQCSRWGKPRLHKHLVNGGVLAMRQDWSLNYGLPVPEMLVRQIMGSMQLKKIGTLIGKPHMLCGVAALTDIDLFRMVEITFEAAYIFKKRIPDARILNLGDVHLAPEGLRRTYQIVER